MLWDWIARKFQDRPEFAEGGWGIELGVNPGDPMRRALTIQLPYPTTIAFRIRCEDINGNVPAAPTTMLRVRRGNANATEEVLLPHGTYYAGCSELIADIVPTEDPEADPEKVRVWAWIPIVHDNIP